MQTNIFDCLAQLQGNESPILAKKRRKRRGHSIPEPSPGCSNGSDPCKLASLDPELDTASTGSEPAELVTQTLGNELLRQSSEGCIDQQASAPSSPQLPPFRSKSDLSNLTEVYSRAMHNKSSGAGLDSIAEQQQQSQSSQHQPQLTPLHLQQPLSPQLRRRRSVSEVLFQPFSEYLEAELHPGPSYPTADVVWGQTERDRVYNAILAVPYQLERFLWFGMFVCLDSFLAVFTLLPVRFAYAVYTAARDCLAAQFSAQEDCAQISEQDRQQQQQQPHGDLQQDQQQQQRQGQVDSQQANGSLQDDAIGPSAMTSDATATAHPTDCGPRLRGDQLCDLLCVLIFLGTVVFLWHLNAGMLYFWMKDLTQEFLKLSVLFTALELSDKICCSFGVDVLEALSASCTQFMAAPSWASREAANLASDTVVAALLVVVHGAALMAQAMVYGVAMNSKKNALVALLIAANFTEIKGTVLKRFDSNKLYVLACQDVVERFHLLITLAFVVVEEMGNSGHTTPNRAVLVQCCQIFFSETIIDVIKHAVLGKFNEIRPGVYREFMKDLCERVSGAQSHNIHKLVGFEPFAPTALAFRTAVTYLAVCSHSHATTWQMCQLAGTAIICWAVLFAAKLLLGYLLKQASASYVRHYESRRANVKGGARRATLSNLASFPAAGKKEE